MHPEELCKGTDYLDEILAFPLGAHEAQKSNGITIPRLTFFLSTAEWGQS